MTQVDTVSASTIDTDRLLADIRAAVVANPKVGLVQARAAYVGVKATSANVAFLRGLFALMREAGVELGVAFSLRALRKVDTLSFGEARRLFLALDRAKHAALIDRYVRWLHRRLPQARLPLRKALNLIWATRRTEAVLEYLGTNAVKRLNDRDMIFFYASQSVKFKDVGKSVPLFAHLVALNPADPALRLALARGLFATGDYVAAVRNSVASRAAGGRSNEVAALINDLLSALHDAMAANPATLAEVGRLTLEELEPVDLDEPPARAIARILSIIAGPEPTRRLRAEPGSVHTLTGLAEAVAVMSQFDPRSRPYRLAIEAAEDLLHTVDPAADIESLDRLLMMSPASARIVADRFISARYPGPGIAVFRALRPIHAAPVWKAAIKLASAAAFPDDVADYADRLAAIPDASVTDLRDAGRAFGADESDRIERFWMTAVAANVSHRVIPAALRSLYLLKASAGFYRIALGVATGTLRGTIDSPTFVEAMRTTLARAWRWSDATGLDALTPDMLDPALPPELALWTQAIVAWANFRFDQTRALLDEGAERWPDSSLLSFRKERILLAVRFGNYGAAAADLSNLESDLSEDGPYSTLRAVEATIRAAPPPPDGFYPQYLIDAMFDRGPIRLYKPRESSLVTIVAALSSGGSERQTVSVIEALMRDPRVATQSLLVRSVTPDRRAFFLPQVAASGVALHVFEHDPADISHVLEMLGELPESALSVALPLLPESLRTTICQLVPLLLERRPAVVHIRQDFFPAALACVLAGVPRFFIHRGSLTPDHWDLSAPQHVATVAPMRHVYHRLTDWPGFGFINNALSGVRSDWDWTGGNDPARFSLVHNIVDFAWLGPSSDPDDPVRRSIGAAPGDLVVGAAYRFHRVKRPLLWLAAARRILASHPEARFLILGDGEMKDAMMQYAEIHGFGDRLHLPGSVSDIGPWYRAMDVALLTSDREGLPNMLIEAQHFGVIPVSTDVGGAAETMDPGVTGMLVPADASPEAIGDAVVAAFDDRAWFQRARAQAPDYVHERFGARTAVDRLIELYEFGAAGR